MSAEWERVGIIADDLDSLVAATLLPMPPEFHLKQLKRGIKEQAQRLKVLYRDATGNDPWEGTPAAIRDGEQYDSG